MSEPATIAWVMTAVLLAISVIIVLVLITGKQKGTPRAYRRVVLTGLLWFFLGLALMVAYIFMNTPFWIGLPVAVIGLLYQLIGLWRQWKVQRK
jgi:hypothetical protein